MIKLSFLCVKFMRKDCAMVWWRAVSTRAFAATHLTTIIVMKHLAMGQPESIQTQLSPHAGQLIWAAPTTAPTLNTATYIKYL
jgi:hypothetical protein